MGEDLWPNWARIGQLRKSWSLFLHKKQLASSQYSAEIPPQTRLANIYPPKRPKHPALPVPQNATGPADKLLTSILLASHFSIDNQSD